MSKEEACVDVLCVGHATYDLTFSVKEHPLPDEKVTALRFIGCGGGPAANAAVTVSRLGFQAAFCGYIGNDMYGEMHYSELVDEGVYLDLVVRGESPIPLSFILVKPDGKRSLVNYRGDTKPIPQHDIDISSLKTKAILFDGHEPLISPPIVELAKSRGIITILDAGSVHKGTKALITEVDYLVCSEKFAFQFTGGKEYSQALSILGETVLNVVITLGGEGLIWKSSQDTGFLAAYSIKAIDTTGAGDVFHGAFAACLAEGKDWLSTLQYANAAAALSCTKVGARRSVPNNFEVEDFLRNNEGIN